MRSEGSKHRFLAAACFWGGQPPKRFMESEMKKKRRDYMRPDEYEKIRPHIKRFEEDVWFGSLADHVRNTRCRGQQGRAGNLDVLAWTCAGRTMITIKNDSGDWCSLMVAEKSNTLTMGLHERSIDGVQLRDWLLYVSDHWSGVEDSEDVTLDVLELWRNSE